MLCLNGLSEKDGLFTEGDRNGGDGLLLGQGLDGHSKCAQKFGVDNRTK
jgi:hypothetical protein